MKLNVYSGLKSYFNEPETEKINKAELATYQLLILVLFTIMFFSLYLTNCAQNTSKWKMI